MMKALFLIALICQVSYAAQGCKPHNVRNEGFDMNLYHYEYYNTSLPMGWCFSSEYQKYDYQHGGYVTFGGGLFASTTGVTEVSLDIYPPDLCTPYVGNLPANFHYDEEFTISNFTMLLTGYFRPSMTGYYMFNLTADDLAYLSFGDGNAFDCCGEEASVTDPDAFDLIVIWQSATDMSGNVTYYLEENIYYPIRLLYANRDYYGVLHLTYTDPDGVLHDDFTDHIYQADDQVGGCANHVAYTTTEWTGTYTTTYSTTVYTRTGSDGFGTIETTYFIETPQPHTTSTVYTPGTFSGTTTVSTVTTTTVGTDSINTVETIFIVETPTSTSEISTSSTVTPSSTSEISTSSTVTPSSTSEISTSSIVTPTSAPSSSKLSISSNSIVQSEPLLSSESSIIWSTVSVPSTIPSTQKEVDVTSSRTSYSSATISTRLHYSSYDSSSSIEEPTSSTETSEVNSIQSTDSALPSTWDSSTTTSPRDSSTSSSISSEFELTSNTASTSHISTLTSKLEPSSSTSSNSAIISTYSGANYNTTSLSSETTTPSTAETIFSDPSSMTMSTEELSSTPSSIIPTSDYNTLVSSSVVSLTNSLSNMISSDLSTIITTSIQQLTSESSEPSQPLEKTFTASLSTATVISKTQNTVATTGIVQSLVKTFEPSDWNSYTATSTPRRTSSQASDTITKTPSVHHNTNSVGLSSTSALSSNRSSEVTVSAKTTLIPQVTEGRGARMTDTVYPGFIALVLLTMFV